MLIFLYLRGSEVKIFIAEGFVNHVSSSREDLFSGTHNVTKTLTLAIAPATAIARGESVESTTGSYGT